MRLGRLLRETIETLESWRFFGMGEGVGASGNWVIGPGLLRGSVRGAQRGQAVCGV